jgi:hypothetical protein
MRIVGTSSNGGSQESDFYSNSNRNKGRGGKTSFSSQHKSLHSGHHQYESQPHGGGQGYCRGKGSNDSNCYYCEKHGHMVKNCYQMENDA